MRPAERGNLTLSVRREEGRIKVVVDALDKENQFLNFLQIQGNVVDPDLESAPIELVQTSPGRYEGTVENAEASGNYFVNLGYRGPDKTRGVISTGVSVPYSDEYRELRSNPTTLETLASLTEGQVVTWKTTGDGRIDVPRTLGGIDHFRRDPGLINPRSFAGSGRPCSGWRPACSRRCRVRRISHGRRMRSDPSAEIDRTAGRRPHLDSDQNPDLVLPDLRRKPVHPLPPHRRTTTVAPA